MITVEFEKIAFPLGLRTRIISKVTRQESRFDCSWDNLVNNPTSYFGEARHALTVMAKELATIQDNLSKDDERACDAAMRKFASGYGQPSYRDISAVTAALVHGIAPGPDLHPKPVTISLEPFDVKIGKVNSKGKVMRGLKNFNTSFMLEDTNQDDMTPGTRYVIDSLQNAAKFIEQYYMNEVGPTAASALPISSAPYPGEFKDQTLKEKWKERIAREQAKVNNSAIILPEVSVAGHGYVDTTNVSADQTSGHDYGLIFTDPEGRSCAVDLKSPRFNVTPQGAGSQVVNIIAGEFNPAEAVLIGDSPLSARSDNAKNPSYWAHMTEDKVNGVKQQAIQNLPEDDPTRVLICAISDLLSDHIHNMGTEEEAP